MNIGMPMPAAFARFPPMPAAFVRIAASHAEMNKGSKMNNPKNKKAHRRILAMLEGRYDAPLMPNLHRADYVECLVASALGDGWRLPWKRGWHWAPWDLDHPRLPETIEVKQSAALQAWTAGDAQRVVPRFDIEPRKGYWREDGSAWVDSPGRQADIWVFAWHGESRRKHADHRDPSQWRFFVAAKQQLPDQKGIGLRKLEKIASPCRVTELGDEVENARLSTR